MSLREQHDRALRTMLEEAGVKLAGERKSVFVLPDGGLLLKADCEVRAYLRRHAATLRGAQ